MLSMEFAQHSPQKNLSDSRPSSSSLEPPKHAPEQCSPDPYAISLEAQNTLIEQQNAMLIQQNEYLMRQHEQMELAIQRMQMFAVIGPPPGLSGELHMIPAGSGPTQSAESAHTGDSCSRSNSDMSISTPSKGDHKHCASDAFAGYQQRSPGSSPRPSSNADSKHSVSDTWTTMIIRNLVDHCTKTKLMNFLDSHGLHGEYNLLYLPLCFTSQRCFHYAFVNFVSEDVAEQFKACFHGCTDATIFTESAAHISFSECQGLTANIVKYRNSSVMHKSVPEECKPVLLEHGKVIPFPSPTKKIKEDRRIRKGVEQPVGCLKTEL